MVCYILHFPKMIDYEFMRHISITEWERLSRDSCLVTDLEDWQIEELTNLGCSITEDRSCSI